MHSASPPVTGLNGNDCLTERSDDMSFNEERRLESAYVMGTYARKPVELVRGRGMRGGGRRRPHLPRLRLGRGRGEPGPLPSGARLGDRASRRATLVHVSNYYYIEHRGEVAHARVGPAERMRRRRRAHAVAELLLQLGRRGERVRVQAGAPARQEARRRRRRARPEPTRTPCAPPPRRAAAHRHARRQLPRAHARHARRHGAARQAGGVPAAARRLRPHALNDVDALEALFAEQGDAICALMVECVQGESGVHPCTAEFLQAARRLTERARRAAHVRRNPVRHVPLRHVSVRLPAFRRDARRGDHRQGHRLGLSHGHVRRARRGGRLLRRRAITAPRSAAAAWPSRPPRPPCARLPTRAWPQTPSAWAPTCARRSPQLPHVAEVRGLGLMVAADLDEGVSAPDVVLRAWTRACCSTTTGPRTLRFLPPLVCSEADVDVLAQKLGRLLGA